jgi:hypothetical protein
MVTEKWRENLSKIGVKNWRKKSIINVKFGGSKMIKIGWSKSGLKIDEKWSILEGRKVG